MQRPTTGVGVSLAQGKPGRGNAYSVVFGSLYAVENAQDLSLDEVDKDKVDRCVIKH